MAERILEVKRHLDGRVQEFDCERLFVSDALAILKGVNEKPLGSLAPGSTSIGFIWRRRDYNVFRLISPDGELIGHRCDVVADVRIKPDRVEYLDLIVDVMISPTGELTVEDEDDAKRAAKQGLLEPRHVEAIDRALKTIMRDPRRIIRDALRSLPEGFDAGG